jgi:hypothetical protein
MVGRAFFIIPDEMFIFSSLPLNGGDENMIPDAKHVTQVIKCGFVVPFKGVSKYNNGGSNSNMQRPKWISDMFLQEEERIVAAAKLVEAEQQQQQPKSSKGGTVKPRKRKPETADVPVSAAPLPLLPPPPPPQSVTPPQASVVAAADGQTKKQKLAEEIGNHVIRWILEINKL